LLLLVRRCRRAIRVELAAVTTPSTMVGHHSTHIDISLRCANAMSFPERTPLRLDALGGA
jgi:hypothetical protein